MAQIANRGPGRNEDQEAANTAREAVNRTEDLGREVTGRTADTIKEVTGRFASTARQALDGSTRAAGETFQAESELARLWLEVTSQQLHHNAETLQRLAATRDWREAIEIQNAFMQDSLSRMADGLTRHLDLTGDIATRLIRTGREQLDKARAA
jgi:hypothetical protein